MATEKKSKNRWVDAISSMIELTQDGKLRWTVVPDASVPYDRKEITTSVFQTTYNDRALRLYEIRIPANPNTMLTAMYSVQGVDPPKWYREVILEFVDIEGHALWTFPQVDALSDLLTSVQYQVAGVNDFLDTIISEARNVPKPDSAKGLKDMAASFRERGEALGQIVKIANDASKSDEERLDQIRRIAFNAIAKPTF